jgi:hypothetical protein
MGECPDYGRSMRLFCTIAEKSQANGTNVLCPGLRPSEPPDTFHRSLFTGKLCAINCTLCMPSSWPFRALLRLQVTGESGHYQLYWKEVVVMGTNVLSGYCH